MRSPRLAPRHPTPFSVSHCASCSDQSQAFLIRYLTTFERGSVADVDADARERAKEAAIGYVKAPLLSTRSNLPQLKAVRDSCGGGGELACFLCGDCASMMRPLYRFTCPTPSGWWGFTLYNHLSETLCFRGGLPE